MHNKNLWLIVLAAVVILAIVSGFWVIEETLKIALYVILAILAIVAIMMIVRAGKNAATHSGHGTHV